MTDSEIAKALECCVSVEKCDECPMFKDSCKSGDALHKPALDLINRQQAENEQLKKDNEQFADIGKMYSEIKSEAIKEFADKVKSLDGNRFTYHGYDGIDCYACFKQEEFEQFVDNLVKEMVCEEKTPSVENNFLYNRFMKKE